MNVITADRSAEGRSPTHETAGRGRLFRFVPALMIAQGSAIGLLVALDGSATWRIVRAVATILMTALAVWLQSRAGARGRAATALAAGAVGTIVGAGIGLVHVAKVGASLTALLGLVALVTGVPLLVWGGISLTRAMRGWWRLLALPAALGLLVFVLFPLSMAVTATNRPSTALGADTPADRGFTYRDVGFLTADGVRLSGWYIPSITGAAVLLLHGAGSTRSAVLDHAVVLARHGYGALLLDTRGHGLSEGHAMDFGWYGGLDASAAVSFLTRQPDVDPARIAVLGLSMGGEQAVVAAGSDERIRAVVAEGVTGEQAMDHGWLPGGITGGIQRGLEWVMFTGADLLSDASPPMSMRAAIAAAAPRPFLLVAGGAVADEAIAGRWFQEDAPSTVTIWTVPESPHIGALATAPKAWEGAVVSFLDTALALKGGEESRGPDRPGLIAPSQGGREATSSG